MKSTGNRSGAFRRAIPVLVGLVGVGLFAFAGSVPGGVAADVLRDREDRQLATTDGRVRKPSNRGGLVDLCPDEACRGTRAVAQAGRVVPDGGLPASGPSPGGSGVSRPQPISTPSLRMTGVGDSDGSEARPVIATGGLTMTGIAGVSSVESSVISTNELRMTGVGQ